jgi:hypothetical protein
MKQVAIYPAKTHLSKLVDLALAGELVVIYRRDSPLVNPQLDSYDIERFWQPPPGPTLLKPTTAADQKNFPPRFRSSVILDPRASP